jgi:hypothetical protein
VSAELVIKMMHNVNANKAIAFDGISDKLFQINKDCRSAAQLCEKCKKKITFVAGYLEKEYWDDPRARELHLRGRLVALNKKHPQVPLVHQYRPIVVLSPVVQFL